jgi:hypothetical protein
MAADIRGLTAITSPTMMYPSSHHPPDKPERVPQRFDGLIKVS